MGSLFGEKPRAPEKPDMTAARDRQEKLDKERDETSKANYAALRARRGQEAGRSLLAFTDNNVSDLLGG